MAGDPLTASQLGLLERLYDGYELRRVCGRFILTQGEHSLFANPLTCKVVIRDRWIEPKFGTKNDVFLITAHGKKLVEAFRERRHAVEEDEPTKESDES